MLYEGGNSGDGVWLATATRPPTGPPAASGDSGDGGKDESVGAELHTGRRLIVPAEGAIVPAQLVPPMAKDEADDLLMGRLIVLLLRYGLPLALFAASGSATVTTRNREFEGKKSVGELPVDEGDGDDAVPPAPPPPPESLTRDTWNRLRDGLGTGEAAGEGMGLGNGERKRPPVDFLHPPFGSSRCCLSAIALGDVLIDGQVREILRELR